MIVLAFKNFIRSNSVKIGLSFLLIAGIVSLFVGKQFIEKQEQNITETAAYQKEYIARNVHHHQDEIGLLLYYLKFSFVNETLPINGLSIGQRDVNSSIQSLTIRGLEAQKYDADLNNPTNLLLGNIDFSFVLIFLFPLIIIAFTYNIISEEKESGTWRIVAIQSKNLFLHVLQLFFIRFIGVISVLFFILLLSVFFLKIPLESIFFSFVGISLLYILCWFGICFWVASLQKSSNANAVILLSIWIVLIIILPASLNNYLVNKYPVPEALSTTLKQRKGYHEKWDTDKTQTMNRFYAHYPQFKQFPLPDKEFSWLWYYAMQQIGDDEAAIQATAFKEKLNQRNRASNNIAQFIPTIHTQMQLNEIAQAGLSNHLQFLEETGKFHEKMRLYFYPKIFGEAPVNSENWNKFSIETFKNPQESGGLQSYLSLVVFILLFGVLGWVNFKKSIYQV
ncbi:DUF3526 domain-containing protein [Arcicella rosea]|uniref:ABC-2 type transport system permease protein n=1 Tax=Arcicella rosea TaxID=502909 RepID=A0A841ETA1_9BACT|nr:DUF3526 domain-containing protein [Arcicella rosea]MBB6004273.1 ABC-2 type transport system permease protein [Arcicella rosea]